MEKTNVTSKKFTSEIIWGVILYGIIFGIVASFVKPSGTDLLSIVITAVINIIVTILVWIFGVKSVLKKKTTSKENISKIMKCLWIFVIVIIVLSLLLDVFELKMNIQEIEENTTKNLEMYESTSETFKEIMKQQIDESLQSFYDTQLPQLYVMYAVLFLVDLITQICMLRYTKYKLESSL